MAFGVAYSFARCPATLEWPRWEVALLLDVLTTEETRRVQLVTLVMTGNAIGSKMAGVKRL